MDTTDIISDDQLRLPIFPEALDHLPKDADGNVQQTTFVNMLLHSSNGTGWAAFTYNLL